MDIAKGAAIERVARVIAGQRLSANARGDDPHAAEAVDREWPRHREDAVAVLRTLRDPDEAMAAAGDVAVWQRMIAAALGDDVPASNGAAQEPPPPGTDPLHEGP